MEFIRVGKNYMIKNSNGRIVSEKEKLQLENKEMIIKDFESKDCQKETTKKISKNKKKIKKLEKKKEIKETAPEKEADVDDIIEETNKSV